MPYSGQTYTIPCDVGGWSNNPNTDLIKPENMIDCLNINLHQGGRETRGGVEEVNETAITSGPDIMGLFQFKTKAGASLIVTGTNDGKIQKDYATGLKTGLGEDKYYNFCVFEDTLYICNGNDVPQTWDGVAVSTSDLADIPADWTDNSFPKGMIKHGKGASERLWAFGCPDNPETIYVSATGTADFSDASVTKIVIETGDGSGIVGLVEYGDRLIALGRKKPYLIDDTELDVANWGYVDAQWEGGAAHHRLVCKTPNDVVAMSDDGQVYSILTAQTYGDYIAQSLTRPVYIDTWIKENIDLSKIAQFHMVYDSVLRAVKIFMVRKKQTDVDFCLVYFIDRGPENGWVKHQFADSYFASCSAEVEVSTGVWEIYTGGTNGHVYSLESDTLSDDDLYYPSSFTLPELTFGNPRLPKRYDKVWAVIKPQGTETIKVSLIVDGLFLTGGYLLGDENGYNIGDEEGDMIGGGAALSWEITSTGASNYLTNNGFSLGIIGKRIQAEFFNNAIEEKFFISQILFDFIPLQAMVT